MTKPTKRKPAPSRETQNLLEILPHLHGKEITADNFREIMRAVLHLPEQALADEIPPLVIVEMGNQLRFVADCIRAAYGRRHTFPVEAWLFPSRRPPEPAPWKPSARWGGPGLCGQDILLEGPSWGGQSYLELLQAELVPALRWAVWQSFRDDGGRSNGSWYIGACRLCGKIFPKRRADQGFDRSSCQKRYLEG
jgi:hypothetical protein